MIVPDGAPGTKSAGSGRLEILPVSVDPEKLTSEMINENGCGKGGALKFKVNSVSSVLANQVPPFVSFDSLMHVKKSSFVPRNSIAELVAEVHVRTENNPELIIAVTSVPAVSEGIPVSAVSVADENLYSPTSGSTVIGSSFSQE